MSKKKRRTELNQLIEKYKRYSLVEEVEKSLQEKKGIFYSSNELFLSDLYEEKYYDLNAYSSLLESIKKDGLLYPLIIVKQNDGFEIINGAKRFLLAKKLGIEKLPCFLINLSGKRKVSYIVENIIAENDSPLLKAHCFYTLSHKYHYSDIEIAKEANISLAQEKNLKRLLNLPEFLKKALNSFQLSYMAARYYPKFTRCIYLKGYRYNLHMRPRSILLEVGAQTNTVQEAMNAMEPFSVILNKVLKGE